jgi:hypothetical protein
VIGDSQKFFETNENRWLAVKSSNFNNRWSPAATPFA